MENIEQKLVDLTRLQLIHSKIDEIHRLRGELPMEVQDLEDELAGLEIRKGKLRDDINELEDSIIKRRNTIKEAEDAVTKYSRQIDEVKNNREFEALTKEIEVQKLDVQISEKAIREFSEKITFGTEKYEEVCNLIETRTQNLELKKEELGSILKETEKEEQELSDLAKQAEKKIEERLIKAYYRLRNNYKNKQAVVCVDRNACSGCFCEIPPQRQVEIRQRKKINVCEHCGRIVVDDSTLEAAEKKNASAFKKILNKSESTATAEK